MLFSIPSCGFGTPLPSSITPLLYDSILLSFLGFVLFLLLIMPSMLFSSSSSPSPTVQVDQGRKEISSSNGNEWSFFSSLYTTPKESFLKVIEKPSYKQSPSPMAGKRNLEMCTETLGCETGAVYTADDYKLDGFPMEKGDVGLMELEERRRNKKEMVEKRIRRVRIGSGLLPPPLTTLAAGSRLQIVSKREDGRVIMSAVKPTMMEAERGDGRLRLRLLSDCESSVSSHGHGRNAREEETEKEAEEEVKTENGGEEEEELFLGFVGREMNGMGSKENGEEMEIAKYRRAGRCIEEAGGGGGGGGGHGRRSSRRENWEAEAIWVASS